MLKDKKQNYFPKVSIVMPTLNSERTIEESLESITVQSYLGDMEIIVADGGSTDKTLEIARKYKTRIIKNVLKTGEAGKAIGAKMALGDIIAFVDSDNVLPNKTWIKDLVTPFLENKEIIASEPLYFTYRQNDYWLTRYFALLGMGDPLNLFLGNYDRYSYITNKWTEMTLEYKDQKKYLEITLDHVIPTIGANGFVILKSALMEYPIKDYLFDIDVLHFLVKDHTIKVAKVKTGIVHLFTGDIYTFIRKQRRRIRDFLYFQTVDFRIKQYNNMYFVFGVMKFALSTIFILPLIYQMMIGYSRKKDTAWFCHPLICWITLLTYSAESIRGIFIREQFNRSGWKQ